jgi:hypothetical protein
MYEQNLNICAGICLDMRRELLCLCVCYHTASTHMHVCMRGIGMQGLYPDTRRVVLCFCVNFVTQQVHEYISEYACTHIQRYILHLEDDWEFDQTEAAATFIEDRCACMYVCMYTCMYVCMYVYI